VTDKTAPQTAGPFQRPPDGVYARTPLAFEPARARLYTAEGRPIWIVWRASR